MSYDALYDVLMSVGILCYCFYSVLLDELQTLTQRELTIYLVSVFPSVFNTNDVVVSRQK